MPRVNKSFGEETLSQLAANDTDMDAMSEALLECEHIAFHYCDVENGGCGFRMHLIDTTLSPRRHRTALKATVKEPIVLVHSQPVTITGADDGWRSPVHYIQYDHTYTKDEQSEEIINEFFEEISDLHNDGRCDLEMPVYSIEIVS